VLTSPDLAADLRSLDNPLEGRVAVVTGGTRGIGLACTVGLAALGATVVAVGRSAPQAEAVAQDLVAQGLDVVGAGVDVADAAAVRALPDRLGPLGAPDLLVCAAGVMSLPTSKTLRTDQAEWDRVLRVNLDGVFSTVGAFGPAMTARRSGRVVVLSACLGRMSGPGTAGGLAPYRVSKAAVNALVRNLAHETGLGARGVTVDAVCPGHCRTDMGGPDAPRSAAQGADTVLWLCTREALTPTGLLWEDRDVVPF
jgi:3-oxoacyl-[acyl-carrier protein] reductase